MKYQYNFGFFDEWIKANPRIPKGKVQEALGVKANNGLKKWKDGSFPMPIISMLRFCNTFNVPLSSFFRNMDGNDEPAVVPGLPRVDDQLEPTGGYIDNMNMRRRGESSLLNPLDVIPCASNLPESVTESEVVVKTDEEKNTNNNEDLEPKSTQQNFKSLYELEKMHKIQINRLLDIIAQQQSLISDLHNKLIAHDDKKKIYDKDEYPLQLVAED